MKLLTQIHRGSLGHTCEFYCRLPFFLRKISSLIDCIVSRVRNMHPWSGFKTHVEFLGTCMNSFQGLSLELKKINFLKQ